MDSPRAWTIGPLPLRNAPPATVRRVTMEDGAAAAVHEGGGARRWWGNRGFVALGALSTAIPPLYPPIPPLVDLFGHMGRYRVELDVAHSPWLGQYYGYHWAAIGNLGVDLLVKLLAPVFGLEPTVK